jgi:hypothetical protein
MPNTAIQGDASFRVIDANTMEIRKGERWQRYKKCTIETNPKLDYSTMQGRPNTALASVRVKPYYKGVPDYENTTVFQAEPRDAHSELRALLQKTSTGLPTPGRFSLATF